MDSNDLFNQVLDLSSDSRVELGDSFKSLLHKKLVLGQTRYVCRYGTLSDGHDKLTPSQKYFQCFKEMYSLAQSVKVCRVNAKRAQADLLDAEVALAEAKSGSDKLRAEASYEEASTKLMGSLVSIEDMLRQIDEYNRVRLELEEQVEAQYPDGIEAAEEDNWKTVYEFRMAQDRAGLAKARIDNIPLNPVTKAQLSYEFHREDGIFPLAVVNLPKVKELADEYQAHIQQITQDQSTVAPAATQEETK